MDEETGLRDVGNELVAGRVYEPVEPALDAVPVPVPAWREAAVPAGREAAVPDARLAAVLPPATVPLEAAVPMALPLETAILSDDNVPLVAAVDRLTLVADEYEVPELLETALAAEFDLEAVPAVVLLVEEDETPIPSLMASRDVSVLLMYFPFPPLYQP